VIDKSASRRGFLQHMTALGALGGASAGFAASDLRAAEPRLIARRAGPAFTRRAVGSECNLIVLDAGDVLHDAFAVRRPCIDAESKVSPECGHLRFLPSSVSRGPRFGLPRCVGQALATEAIAE